MTIYTRGIGETLGDTLLTSRSPIYLSGQIWYVNSTDGDDTYDGREKLRPLATLAQGYANAAAGDTIALLDGHTETLAAVLTIAKKVSIIGSGKSSGKPTVKLYNNQAADNLLFIDAVGVQVRNIWFGADQQACSAACVYVNEDNCEILDCYFERDELSASSAYALYMNPGTGNSVSVRNTTLISTAVDPATPPPGALLLVGRSRMTGCVFDGGTVGWLSPDGPYALTAADSQIMEAEGMSLLRGSDVGLGSGVTGYVQVTEDSAGALIATGITVGG